ncbi:probable myosin-binding protein 4 isoform X2 [Primulina huaijiensis]|uniref:probable myosin-binding protein 4 isoform X2 n=1 Tax=Primulina huaijiensis TaxID=1492673 RepID=UPI003CC75C43
MSSFLCFTDIHPRKSEIPLCYERLRMAAERSSLKKRAPTGYMTFLASAPCEWILIFLLFVYAALTYFLTKFAQFCELKPPCLLCSRLDHVFGEKKSSCYWSSLCSTHREEISTLVPCAVHDKLADVNGMCEECFLPIAMGNKSNSESYRLLVGKLWVDVERSALQSLMFNKHIKYHFSGRRACSCCNKTWGAIFNTERFLGFGSSVGIGASKANVKLPQPRVLTRSRFSRRDSLKRLRDKFTGTMSHLSAVSSGFDTLSHVGYAKPKISPDSESEAESEAIIFEDDGGNASTHGKNGSEHEYDVWYDRRGLPRTQGNELALESKSNQGYDVKPLVPDALNLLDLCENKNTHFSSSGAFEEQGPRELNWVEYYHKPSKYLTAEIDAGRGSLGAPAETSKSIVSIPQTLALPVLSELPLYNDTTLFSTMTILDQHIEAFAGFSSDTVHPSKLNDMNPTDVSTRGMENKELTSTHASGHDYAENEEEMESLIKEFSTSEVGSSSKVTSPSASDKHYEFRTGEIPILASLGRNDSDHHESSDGISDGDIIGEGIVDRLKRQVEHDQICISSLHQELEAERGAATIAANQAMAMITRLQEEKASFRMEALQYLRLMEEQAEYDTEALERANDLLYEKEKELQDLEIELEFYRNNIVEKEKELQDLETGMEFYRNNIFEESVVAHCTENSPRASTNVSESSNTMKSNGNCNPMNSSAPNLADEKLYISQCLSKLEKKIHKAYCSRKLDMANGMDSGNMKIIHDVVIVPPDQESTLTLEMEERTLSSQNCMSASNVSPEHEKENGHASEKGSRLSANYGCINCSGFEKEIADLNERPEALEINCSDFEKENGHASDKGSRLSANYSGVNCSDFEKEIADLNERPEALEINCSDFEKENGHASEKGSRLSANYSGINCSDFEKEFADLHERPEALEINQDFLKHVSNLLHNGKDGSQLIHERAHQLQEQSEAEFSER